MLKCEHSPWSLAVGALTKTSSMPKTHGHTIQRPNGCQRAKFDSDSKANVLVHNSKPSRIIHSVSLNADEYSARTPQSWEAEFAHSQNIQPNYRDVVDIGSRASHCHRQIRNCDEANCQWFVDLEALVDIPE